MYLMLMFVGLVTFCVLKQWSLFSCLLGDNVNAVDQLNPCLSEQNALIKSERSASQTGSQQINLNLPDSDHSDCLINHVH